MSVQKITLTSVLTLVAILALGYTSMAVGAEHLTPVGDGQYGFIAVFLCLGFLMACTLYCAYVAVDSKEPSYRYYVLATSSLFWLWCELSGFISPLFGTPLLAAYLFYAGNTLFIERFLALKKQSAALSKGLKASLIVPLIAAIVSVVYPSLSVLFVILLLVAYTVVIGYLSARALLGGLVWSLYCLLGNVLLTLAVFAVLAMEGGAQGRLGQMQTVVLVLGTMVFVITYAFALVGKFIAIARHHLISSEDLERKVFQRNEQLQKANEELKNLAADLKRADEAKSTFLVNMSHEMRTPLTAIIGYADGIAQGDIIADEKHRAMAIIRNNGQHLLDIINDLLDISKIENGTLEIESKPFDPLALVHQLCDMVTAEVEAKQLKFSVIYRLPLPTCVLSDAKRMRQVLLNLVNNAIKFTHQGEIELMVKVVDERLCFSVSDTGIGMNEQQLEQLFQAFSQEDLTKSRQYGGAGLGLNIVKALVDRLGGKIEVCSTQGQGSTFSVEFPLGALEYVQWLEDQAELDRWLAKINAEQGQVQKMAMPAVKGKVLLAEDHPDNQKLFVRMLERMGLEVFAVDNGFKAVQATLDNDFDLVLMDIQMPEMDGIKAFELIQNTCPSVPVVALTANAMQSDVSLYLNLGFKDHIAKPVDRKQFVDTVLKYLGVESELNIALDADELDEIKQQYVRRLVGRIADIKAAQANSDWEEIGKHAHAIKGSAGMFGFDDLSALGAQLELSVKNADQAQGQAQLGQLLAMCEEITTTH